MKNISLQQTVTTVNDIPKIVWIMWYPELNTVKSMNVNPDEVATVINACRESWRYHNPDWEIVFIDENNFSQYLDLDPIVYLQEKKMTLQVFADLVRLNLLTTYGGVWVDATLFCCVPLSEWLNKFTPTGFFAFHRTIHKDTDITIGFLAATRNNLLIQKWYRKAYHFWEINGGHITLSTELTGVVKRKLFRIELPGLKMRPIRILAKCLTPVASKIFSRSLQVRKSAWWFSPVTINILGIYSYLWAFYLFDILIDECSECRRIWQRTPKYDSQTVSDDYIFNTSIFDQEAKDRIDQRKDVLYKISVKKGFSINQEATQYLFNTLQKN